jgi:SSS family solute:Na+ symporter
MWLLRWSIASVAVFALIFSYVFPNPENILMYFALVNNLWLGGSGAVILGGLYWKRGTTTAAIWTLVLGALIGAAGIVVTIGWPYWFEHRFPVNPQWIFFITIFVCMASYIGISLLGRVNYDMDKLLHRGRWAVEHDQTHVSIPTRWHEKIFGIDREFNRRDRLIAYMIVGWFLMWLLVFAIGTIYAWLAQPGETDWAQFWLIYLYILFGMAVITTLWFTIGSCSDLLYFFRSLRTQQRDYSDDGMVKPHPADASPETDKSI